MFDDEDEDPNYIPTLEERFQQLILAAACLGTVRPWIFSTQTKSSKDETSFSTCYNVKEVRISQEKHLSSGFPLSY